MFLVTAVLMHFARRWLGWRITPERHDEQDLPGPVRFNTKALLVWTAFLAMLLALSRITWPFIIPFDIGSFSEVALGTCILGLVFGPLAFVSLSLLSPKLRSPLTIWTAAGFLVAVVAAPLVLAAIEPTGVDVDVFVVFFLVAAGGALACCVTVLPLRLVGYRLTRPTSQQLTP
jgi:hypothetical protein